MIVIWIIQLQQFNVNRSCFIIEILVPVAQVPNEKNLSKTNGLQYK